MPSASQLTVFIASGEVTCDECGANLGRHAWISLTENKQALCLTCADLDHLVFLPAGDAALTRRAGKYSHLSAVVLKWSRARKRYERQGLLVETVALEQAEQECLADSEVRARRREREAVRRAEVDRHYVEQFAARVRQLFPGCPPGREQAIAEHACLKYSDRIGRTAAAKELDERAVQLAVIAHIRHVETPYDVLLGQGLDRREARAKIATQVEQVVAAWTKST